MIRLRTGRRVSLRILGALGALGVLVAVASCTSPARERQALRPRLAQLIAAPGESVAGESLLEREAVVAFYEAREGRPAWNPEAGAASIREAITAIALDGLHPADYHLARIDSLVAQRAAHAGAEFDSDLEILLTDAAAAMIDHARYGRVLPALLDTSWNVDPRKGAPPIAEALARVARASSPAEGLEREKLDHFIYRGLKEELGRLELLAQHGGWTAIPAGRSVAPGAHDPRVALVRARLAATGELSAEKVTVADSSEYDPDLVAAVKMFQERHRLDGDGKLGATTLVAMNRSVHDRIEQVKVNLERSRWVLPGLEGEFLLVNLPAFKAYVIRDNQNIWETRTQIGKEARQTPSFRADMKYVVFNPTWTVPPTIFKEDVLGGIARGEDMMAKKKLKAYDHAGNVVDSSSIDWHAARKGNFPYTLRQDAGPDNALGRVKFLFPNPYDVYLHDTPSRELFASAKRTFSSGCIRIENPLELAKLLLSDKGYDEAKIDSVLAAGKTKWVNLTAPVPVLIVYWTVSVGSSGEIHYSPDVYHRDAPVLAALAAAPQRPAGSARN